MDRANVGGSQSGQQSGYISRGASARATTSGRLTASTSPTCRPRARRRSTTTSTCSRKCRSTRAAPTSTQQTGGVGINLVTSSGTDRFKGSAPLLHHRRQVPGRQRHRRAQRQTARAPARRSRTSRTTASRSGGPIGKGKLWYWGSYGKQDIKVGVVGFYNADAGVPGHQGRSWRPTRWRRSRPAGSARLPRHGRHAAQQLQLEVQLGGHAQPTSSRSRTPGPRKSKNARNASDTRPIETTYRQGAVSSTSTARSAGTSGRRRSGRPATSTSSATACCSTCCGRTWATTSSSTSTRTRWTTCSASSRSPTGIYAAVVRLVRSVHPADHSVDATISYFLPGADGRRPRLQVRLPLADGAGPLREFHVGGNADAASATASPRCQRRTLYRDSITNYELRTMALYLQDTFTRNTPDAQARRPVRPPGGRGAATSDVPAHPFAPQWLPAITFAGADAGVAWNDFSPRLGLTYDLTGNGKTIVSGSWSIYYGQMGPGEVVRHAESARDDGQHPLPVDRRSTATSPPRRTNSTTPGS